MQSDTGNTHCYSFAREERHFGPHQILVGHAPKSALGMTQERDIQLLDPQVLREIVEGTAAETGAGFFDALAKHLAAALGTKCAWVTEWLPEQRRLRALSFWARDHYISDFEYDVAGTPCEPVI